MRFSQLHQFLLHVKLLRFNVKLVKKILFPLLILVFVAIFSCRVERAQETFQSVEVENKLYFPSQSAAVKGELKAPYYFSQTFSSIEPPQPSSLAGFGGAARRVIPPNFSNIGGFFTYCLPYLAVDLPPRVKVLLWKGQDATGQDSYFSLINLDLVAVSADATQKIVAALDRRFPDDKLSTSNVNIVATHTHSGPSGLSENPFWGAFACDRFVAEYWNYFESKIVDSYAQARSSLKQIDFVSQKQGDLSEFNRTRFPGMAVDSRMLSLEFYSSKEQGNDSGCFFIYAVHPTWYSQTSRTLSSDIPGHLEKAISHIRGQRECTFFNGAVGNADSRNAQNIDTYSARFASSFLELGKQELQQMKDFKYAQNILNLPAPTPNLKACQLEGIDILVAAKILDQMARNTKIGLFSIGSTLFILFPGEAVMPVQEEFERKIREKYPKYSTVRIISLANDYLGYVVDGGHYEEKTLESCSTLYGGGVGELILNRVLDMLENL